MRNCYLKTVRPTAKQDPKWPTKHTYQDRSNFCFHRHWILIKCQKPGLNLWESLRYWQVLNTCLFNRNYVCAWPLTPSHPPHRMPQMWSCCCGSLSDLTFPSPPSSSSAGAASFAVVPGGAETAASVSRSLFPKIQHSFYSWRKWKEALRSQGAWQTGTASNGGNSSSSIFSVSSICCERW